MARQTPAKMLAEMRLRVALKRAQEVEAKRWFPKPGDHPPPQWETPPATIEPEVLPPAQSEIVKTDVQVATKAELRQLIIQRFPLLHKSLTALEPQQFRALVDAVWLIGAQKRNFQVIAPTGAGKTYVQLGTILVCRELYPERFPYNRMWLLLAPPAVVNQTLQVATLPEFGGGKLLLSTLVKSLASINVGALGDAFVEWRTVVQNSMPVLFPFWRPNMLPCAILLDESQQVKNEDSGVSKLIMSAAYSGIPVSFWSMTPYSRPCQTRTIACCLQPDVRIGDAMVRLTPALYPAWISARCAPDHPSEWSPAALKRVQAELEPQTVRFTCKYKHRLLVRVASCRFRTQRSFDRYIEAFEAWQRIREEKGHNRLVGMAELLVAIQKFNQVAEEERTEPLADYGIELYRQKERGAVKPAIIFGFAHKTSLDRWYEYIKQRLDPRLIALIYGGQSESERNREVGRFKSDRAPILGMTLACGGAGLSLHHSPTNHRQRYSLASFVWNDIQQAQFAGRTQRLNSQSASYLILLYFEGTEEVRKVEKTKRKLRAMRQIITPTEGAGGIVEESDSLEHIDAGKNMRLALTDEEEELAANALVGTQAESEVELLEEDE